eukprot:CAMPEP_0182424802 /NCGR_PEP_ID=MMETSP1167-20130531/11068_1 /TAXON_ID=2988 /ORGANISM="Mallomonas Sp, Strain CCMP3275" /LENGTH=341 /DNA_ID=CAMNT_0024604895 /DNA_START=106 /DNA_END=1131 /DNA_ORIENTATION=+
MSYGMSCKGKLDLMNPRFSWDSTICNDRVYDSLEHSYMPPKSAPTNTRIHTSTVAKPTDSPVRIRLAPRNTQPLIGHCSVLSGYEPRSLTDKGVPINSIPLVPHNLHLNKTAYTFHSHKPRLNSSTMNQVLDRRHDTPHRSLGWDESPDTKGGCWSDKTLQREKPREPLTDKGPGDYDGSRWESFERGGLSTPYLTSFPKTEKTRSFPSLSSAPPVTAYFEDISYKPCSQRAPRLGADKSNRFHHMFKRERHVTTTGLLLSHDYDRESAWGKPDVPVTLCLKESARPATKAQVFPVPSLMPDSGTKMSLKRTVETSPMKYSAVFKTKTSTKKFIPMKHSNY